jgi:hypothetical protein
MDSLIVKAALSGLECELEQARDAKSQIEREIPSRPRSYAFEDAEAALPAILDRLYDILAVVLEAAGLRDTRSRLVSKWSEFEADGGTGKTQYNAQFSYLESKPFEYLGTLLDGLRISTGEPLSSSDAHDLAKLEMILRKTAVLVRRREVKPRREQDVQLVMHDYLEAFFTEYRHPVKIPGITKDYTPDGGVRNLKVAIEFKYASTADEVSRALAGIFEDSRGYNGSLDWTHFYSVIYQTEPFESEDRIKSEMERGGVTWKAIVVAGGGSRRPRRKARGASRSGSR